MDIGIDIVELDRIKKLDELAYLRILNQKEILVYEGFANSKRRIEYLAGRIALREAYVKAFNNKNIIYNELAFINLDDGKIEVYYKDIKQNNLKVSLSHSEKNCVAIVLKLL